MSEKMTEENMAAYDAWRLGVGMDWAIDMQNLDADREEPEGSDDAKDEENKT